MSDYEDSDDSDNEDKTDNEDSEENDDSDDGSMGEDDFTLEDFKSAWTTFARKTRSKYITAGKDLAKVCLFVCLRFFWGGRNK